jgi:hypothetical protein
MEQRDMISIAEFSKYPSGRDSKDGEFNGTRFRQDILAPAIRRAIAGGFTVVVSLASVMSFGSSFLEEAFGGLVRKENISKGDLKRVLEVDAGAVENARYKEAILRYIERA